MATLRLHPHKPGGGLAFDLKEILAALQPYALTAYWSVAAGIASHADLDATGDGAPGLEELARSGARIDGQRLAEIARRVFQVIDGEFKGYDAPAAQAPRVILTAIDSTWWEIESSDASLLDRVVTRLGGVDFGVAPKDALDGAKRG